MDLLTSFTRAVAHDVPVFYLIEIPSPLVNELVILYLYRIGCLWGGQHFFLAHCTGNTTEL